MTTAPCGGVEARWKLAPLVASVVVGTIGWLNGHRRAAIVPATLSAFMAVIVTVFSDEELWG